MGIASEDIWRDVSNIVAQACDFDAEAVKPESEFVADLGIDSGKILDLLMTFEEHFEITIEEDEIIGMSTVGDIFEVIEAKLTSGTAQA